MTKASLHQSPAAIRRNGRFTPGSCLRNAMRLTGPTASAITMVAVRKPTILCQLGPPKSMMIPITRLLIRPTQGTDWSFRRWKHFGSSSHFPIIQLTRAETPM